MVCHRQHPAIILISESVIQIKPEISSGLQCLKNNTWFFYAWGIPDYMRLETPTNFQFQFAL